jgi:hypothetical protein
MTDVKRIMRRQVAGGMGGVGEEEVRTDVVARKDLTALSRQCLTYK